MASDFSFNLSSDISPDRLIALCGAAARQVTVRIVAETASTNADLLKNAANLKQSTLLWAHAQTAGRGRAGRAWHSETDATLTFSLAWKFALPLQALAGLPLAVGVAIAESLASRAIDARLKWPNDILRDGRKLAGILIETTADRKENATWAVIGVGINIALPQGLREQIGIAAAAAPELQSDPEQAVAALLTALAEALPVFAQHGFAPFAARWNALHAYAARTVNVLNGATLLHGGQAIGVDESGRLLLDTTAGRIAILAGDVSLRIKEQ